MSGPAWAKSAWTPLGENTPHDHAPQPWRVAIQPLDRRSLLLGRPYLAQPRVRVFWFSGAAWQEGVETYPVDGVPIRITRPAKSVADAFKYRHKLGLDIALEALDRYRRQADFNVDTLLHYARVCRVEGVVRPYLEVLVDYVTCTVDS